ncbi:hypothetical protein [Nocardia amikacinitolerans]|uniref:hypothetical protein n=1 Tax=Nocardia amikacinitolerans TaxID=756689 RepID=UPI0020A5BCD3|nr:hypothetical protein [Nocardia amikacinitolerans]MCP2291030.1 hypothetical protein [Nocardia amikacinitolerans]
MPSQQHELLIDLFRTQPDMIPPLLTALGCQLPEFDKVENLPGDLPILAPTEYHADSVAVLHAADGPVLAVVVEVQLRPDPDKRWSWPVYVAALRARWKCPTVLMVLCPDKRTARWAAKPIDFGYGHPYARLGPLVLDPSAVPVVTELDTAKELPELAVLSAVAHPAHPDNTKVFAAALAALRTFDGDRSKLYYDFILKRLPRAARAVWETLMTATLHNYEYQSDFARRYYADGQMKGEAEGEVRALLTVLEARGIPVSDEVRERITECTDTDLLAEWVRRAVTVATAEELFAE